MASTRTPALALVAVVSALTLSACTPAPTASGGSAADAGRTAVTAVTVAEAEAGGRAFALDRDDDGSWEVHVAVGEREVDVRVAADGTSVQSTRDDDGIDADERAALDAAVTTLADAVRIATTQHAGDEILDEVQLDDDDGSWAWKVEMESGTTVRLSAADGTVVG